MRVLLGQVASEGYASGIAVVKEQKENKNQVYTVSDPEEEIQRFEKGRKAYNQELEELYIKVQNLGQEKESQILKAYQVILGDNAFFGKAIDKVKEQKINIEEAIRQECDSVVKLFSDMEDEYLRQRADDIQNVCNELIENLQGKESSLLDKMEDRKNLVIVADDLTPAETLRMDLTSVVALVTQQGGLTSHTAILAKALGIPALVGTANATELVNDGDQLLVDAIKGEIKVNPRETEKEAFEGYWGTYRERQKQYKKAESQTAQTTDGFIMGVYVNSGDKESIAKIDPNKADGVGLFRTEFLYMESFDYPSEEEQFLIYKEIAQQLKGQEVIIRTMDIGGDKQAPYMKLPKEENPFLGYRAIRISLKEKEVFLTQLRAILRASVYGNIKIMLPMIVTLDEYNHAKELLGIAEQQLKEQEIPYKENVPLGIMIETPAAAVSSDILARHVDFFSIGSNDLIQYTTATDRMNPDVQHLYDSCNPSVLRLISIAATSAKEAGIPIGICGEVGSESILVPLWVAMGIDELSVVPSRLGQVKHIISSVNQEQMKKKLKVVLKLETAKEIREFLTENLKEIEGEV